MVNFYKKIVPSQQANIYICIYEESRPVDQAPLKSWIFSGNQNITVLTKISAQR
jgi:hypothetical protein